MMDPDLFLHPDGIRGVIDVTEDFGELPEVPNDDWQKT